MGDFWLLKDGVCIHVKCDRSACRLDEGGATDCLDCVGGVLNQSSDGGTLGLCREFVGETVPKVVMGLSDRGCVSGDFD
eukprot:6931024-Pyramimonas_sp.AAC.2